MILASWRNKWFLAGLGHSGTVSLLAPDLPELESEGFKSEEKSLVWHAKGIDQHYRIWYKILPNAVGVRFFPELRYKGMRIYPTSWKPETSEPILRCLAGQTGLDYPPGSGMEFVEMLRREGWHMVRDDEWGYVHVDDLEKIEGPPPHGPF